MAWKYHALMRVVLMTLAVEVNGKMCYPSQCNNMVSDALAAVASSVPRS